MWLNLKKICMLYREGNYDSKTCMVEDRLPNYTQFHNFGHKIVAYIFSNSSLHKWDVCIFGLYMPRFLDCYTKSIINLNKTIWIYQIVIITKKFYTIIDLYIFVKVDFEDQFRWLTKSFSWRGWITLHWWIT